MRLYNELTRRVEHFAPRGDVVKVYVCGITPYDTTHLGHAFTYVAFDVLIRHLEVIRGWPVKYAQNVTDIDDDIVRTMRSTGQSWEAIVTRWTERFVQDMRRLNVRPPDFLPAASSAIEQIIIINHSLIDQGRAYIANGNVYYDVQACPTFGELSRLPRDEMLPIANQRGNFPDDPLKRHPLDFVLWQTTQPDEPSWPSAWSRGRPGWHIECSALAIKHLGAQVDIHGGGSDLIFPHHECEIVQSEHYTGVRPFARWWVHVGMVHSDDQKMSKSLGNLVLVDDVLRVHHPDTLRLYLLRKHYRHVWSYSQDQLEETAAWTRTLVAAAQRVPGRGELVDPGPLGPRFAAALDDGLDTPAALEALMQLADLILDSPPGADTSAASDLLRALGRDVLGLWLKPAGEIKPESLPAWPSLITDRAVAPDAPVVSPASGR
jgi:L-cysteine:1D-myo-inositol 2-amino-2-deoxy-alpha-D-glucopyranoside ligase